MKRAMQILLLATLLTLSQASLANEFRIPMHPEYSVEHCDVDHPKAKAYAGYSYHTATGKVDASWWNDVDLPSGYSATKTHDDDVITVKIRVRTPYNTTVTVASKRCWGGYQISR